MAIVTALAFVGTIGEGQLWGRGPVGWQVALGLGIVAAFIVRGVILEARKPRPPIDADAREKRRAMDRFFQRRDGG
jgi:hypothetical protein